MRVLALASLVGVAAAGKLALFNPDAPCLKGNYKAYTLSGLKACFACPVGKYQDTEGQQFCINCPRDTYGPQSARTSLSDCESCPLGKFQAKAGSSYCDGAGVKCEAGSSITADKPCDCKAGSFITVDNKCTKCPHGKYNAYSNSDKCYDCPSNHWNNREGATQCTLCAKGKFNDRAGATYCMFRAPVVIGPPRPVDDSNDCTAGKYQQMVGTAKACFNCPAGQYSGTKNASSCKKCPTGKFNPWAGKTSLSDCELCKDGKTAPNAGSTTCSGSLATTPCRAGFKNVEKIDLYEGGIDGATKRQDDCAPCPDGTYSTANQKSCTRCAPGSEAVGADTHAGVYTNPTAEFKNVVKQRTHGATACTLCQRGTYWHEGACKKCAPGHFNNILGAFACTKCPANHFAHEEGATSCNAVAVPENRCHGGRIFKSCASPCTKTCDNKNPTCALSCVARCECPASKPYWDDRKEVCKDEAECNAPTCPVAKCAAPRPGCHYVPHDLTDANGCLVYPCGLERCTSMCKNHDGNFVKHGWSGPGRGSDWCNSCSCQVASGSDMGNLVCTKKNCGPAPECSHLKCKFTGGHVKVTYNKRESVGMHHHCGHLDPADPRNCMCTCYS